MVRDSTSTEPVVGLVTLTQAAELAGKTSSYYRVLKLTYPDFPRPAAMVGKRGAYLLGELEAWDVARKVRTSRERAAGQAARNRRRGLR